MTTLLIATSRGFICIDENRPEAYLIDSNNGTYYGITYNENRIYVAARRVSYAKGKGRPEEQAGVVLVFNYNFDLVDELLPPFPLRDLHQIYYFENRLWAVCTYDSTIAVYGNGSWEKWRPLGEGVKEEVALKFHLNSIYSFNGRLYLAGSIDRNGIVYEYDLESRRLSNRFFLGYSSHNVWIRNNVISTLSSMNGSKISTDGVSEMISRGNFVRGVVTTEKETYYGVSTALNRSKREGSNLMIKKVFVNGDSPVFYGVNGFGQINEIRLPGVNDYAHPASQGRLIEAEIIRKKFECIPLHTAPIIREISVFNSGARTLYQKLDLIRRKRRLLKEGFYDLA